MDVGSATPGTELARGYVVVRHLSRGSSLDVYDAWSSGRDSRCILKTLRPDRAGSRRTRAGLVREGRLLRRLAHPHLVRGYETIPSIWHDSPVVVLETLGGQTLAHLLDSLDLAGRRMAAADATELGIQVSSVVGYLHRHGLLHLDLKPANVVAEAGRAKVIDLSIARPPGRAPGGRGTSGYMSPEQVRGGELTPAADVWGVGALLFDALAGRPPLELPGRASASCGHASGSGGRASASGSRPASAVAALTDHRVPRVGATRRLPRDLAAIVDACLELDPRARPSIAEVHAGLTALAGRILPAATLP